MQAQTGLQYTILEGGEILNLNQELRLLFMQQIKFQVEVLKFTGRLMEAQIGVELTMEPLLVENIVR